MVCLSRLYYFKFYTGVFHKFHLVSFGELSLVVSDLHSETKDSKVRVRLVTMCRGKLSAIIAQLMSKCL